eukprot:5042749-Prymnesium_polylepis.1
MRRRRERLGGGRRAVASKAATTAGCTAAAVGAAPSTATPGVVRARRSSCRVASITPHSVGAPPPSPPSTEEGARP